MPGFRGVVRVARVSFMALTAATMFRTNWVVSTPAEGYQRKVSHGQHDE
jgi:hypothetical protein